MRGVYVLLVFKVYAFLCIFFQELDQKRKLTDRIVARAKEGDVILLFGAKDEEHNNAVALKEYIENRMKIQL